MIGSAQKRCKEGFLQQGSILLDFDAEAHQKAFLSVSSPSSSPASPLPNNIATLSQYLEPLPALTDIAKTLAKAFSRVLGVEFTEAALSFEEQQQLDYLRLHKYNQDWWNLKKV